MAIWIAGFFNSARIVTINFTFPLFTKELVMSIAQKVIPHRRSVQQSLQHRIHKTSASQIIQTPQSPRRHSFLDHSGPSSNHRLFIIVGHPRFVLHDSPPFLTDSDSLNLASRTEGRATRRLFLRNNDRSVEISIVDLIAARSTEKLSPIDVDGDVVVGGKRRHGCVGRNKEELGVVREVDTA